MLLTKNKNFKEDSNMDKETLSNYGWIVICVLVLAVMLALATPFGKFISGAIENTTTALFQTSKAGLGSAGIDAGELVFGKQDGGAENPDIPDASASKLIPVGGIYTVSADGTTLVGDGVSVEFPETPATNDTYEYGDYVYTYNKGGDYGTEWSVKVKDTSKTSYGTILSEIAGRPITNMFYTFANCRSLITAPVIPNSVTNMRYTFGGCTSMKTYVGSTDTDGDFSNYTISNSVTDMSHTFDNCTSLTTAPTIPSSVTNMRGTFCNCISLTGTIEINANPTSYDECFAFTMEPITLRGSSPILAELANTSYDGNVTVG